MPEATVSLVSCYTQMNLRTGR
ncbi:protein of unknown function [Streptantibioticus cattleyicolor NRRL 8057 = DSM 46488]|nr:protein of unknown function [Streptantibioticus cattleyicolor NRRL 8057 = DSM 46488]